MKNIIAVGAAKRKHALPTLTAGDAKNAARKTAVTAAGASGTLPRRDKLKASARHIAANGKSESTDKNTSAAKDVFFAVRHIKAEALNAVATAKIAAVTVAPVE